MPIGVAPLLWRLQVEVKPFNKEPPPKPVKWQRLVWPRNFYCELCMGVAGPGADVLDCRTCNVVMHYRCVVRKFGPDMAQPREWQCEFCRLHYEDVRPAGRGRWAIPRENIQHVFGFEGRCSQMMGRNVPTALSWHP
jgi:hypothetical protein